MSKLIGISECGGGDTDRGALICKKIADSLTGAGYRSRYLPLNEEFECDINFNVTIVGEDNDMHVEIYHYGSAASCAKSNLNMAGISPWMKAVIAYFSAENVIPTPT